jgi:hypothetical protein
MVSFALPENIATTEGLSQIHLNVLKSVAEGEPERSAFRLCFMMKIPANRVNTTRLLT